ncbi:MAG TPA: hypothetical protein VK569_04800, partial [Bacteroidota bacterium]|nr:hypothetical protein [Bacteroidota bacterium]
MNRIARVLAAALVVVAAAMPAPAGEKAKGHDACSNGTVASLLMGIRSENQGLRESAAFVLGEIKCADAVIPLMQMLH